MASYKDLFPDKWLKAEHLQGRSVVVSIVGVGLETMFNPTSKRQEKRLVAEFHGKKLRLILNKTNCIALASIANSEDYTAWRGHQITLSPAVAPNGKPTITISGAPVKASAPGEVEQTA